ncbi:hypothetical protein AVEN_235224-1 [Araneus ventricosus]|uniref:Uncharacterized protein n=1 Tax=Araneus ventricosus TaxID=182803 RepID=A0A4Y2KA82_ARAVE|nr:hypothetical protein AVEN_235224-1 [Araneus ventricosus]
MQARIRRWASAWATGQRLLKSRGEARLCEGLLARERSRLLGVGTENNNVKLKTCKQSQQCSDGKKHYTQVVMATYAQCMRVCKIVK